MAWRKMRTRDCWHDPPLTKAGAEQSRRAGVFLRGLLDGMAEPLAVKVFCSPTSRTVATAAELARELLEAEASVAPHYGLNCCAAAKNGGVLSVQMPRPAASLLGAGSGAVQLQCWPPAGDVSAVDKRNRQPDGFVQNVVSMVAELQASPGGGEPELSRLVCVLVTHREGIWELKAAAGSSASSGYCSVDAFSLNTATGAVAPYLPLPGQSGQPRQRKTKERNRTDHGAGKASTKVAAADAELAATLARGTGHVVMRRPPPGNRLHPPAPLPHCPTAPLSHCTHSNRCVRRAAVVVVTEDGGATLLWVTPGVRGVWVDSTGVPSGAVVELLSTPQESEGVEGVFVKVRWGEGQAVEGWTKLKNICSA